MTPEEAGKKTFELSAPVVESHVVVELRAVHAPAVSAVVPERDRQRQLAQFDVAAALAEQQQPPRHKFVPQSKLEVQDSPGELRRQEPKGGVHVLQFRSAALAEQQ